VAAALPAFDGQLTRDATGLSVSYTVRNEGTREVCLFNVLPDPVPGETMVIRASTAYVEIEDGTLHVRKMVLPLPEVLRMAERPTPFITRVPPGRTFTEKIVLPVPVSVESPFRHALLSASAPDGTRVIAAAATQATAVTLSIGAFALDPAWKLISLAPDYPDVYRVWPPGPAVDAQVILTLTWRDLPPIPVLDYEVVAEAV
jgi:hypothetical protein